MLTAPTRGFLIHMDFKLNSISTASLRVGIQETISSAIKSIHTEDIKKSLINSKKTVLKYYKLSSATVKKSFILFLELLVRILKRTTLFLTTLRNLLRKRTTSGYVNQITPTNKKIRFPFKKLLKPVVITIVTILIIVGISKLINEIGKSVGTSKRVEVEGAKASQEISREFLFPLRDGLGESLSDIRFFIEKAELRNEIVVQGKRATAVKGRTFLIITFKLTNQYSQAISMNTKDYLRLSLNGNEEEWLAPDIHNDPVEIQAISTKYTRVGFPINDTDGSLILRVGEINGEKEKITLDLK